MAAEFDNFYLVTVYTPNAGEGLKRLDYREKWDEEFRKYVLSLQSKKPVIICGDLNVAHQPIDIARAKESVGLLAPPDAFPLLAPALRRPYSAGLPLGLMATGPVELEFAPVEVVAAEGRWPGMPVILVVDDRSAILAARNGSDVRGHWSTAPSFVAGARLALERFRTP